MPGISVTEGSFVIYDSKMADDINPHVMLRDETPGMACIIQDKTDALWVFSIYPYTNIYNLGYYLSTNNGTTWDSSGIISTNVENGVPDAVETLPGRIVVYYFKPNIAGYGPLIVVPNTAQTVGKSATTMEFVIVSGSSSVDMTWTAKIEGYGFSVLPVSGTETKQDALMWRSYTENYGGTWVEEIVGTSSIVVSVIENKYEAATSEHAENSGNARTGVLTITAKNPSGSDISGSPMVISVVQDKGI